MSQAAHRPEASQLAHGLDASHMRGAGFDPAPRCTTRSPTPALPWWSVTLALLALAVHALPGSADWLAWDRSAVATGEIWRLLTGHLVHWSTGHLIWDVGTFLGLGVLCERCSRPRFLATLLVSSLAIPLAVGIWLPQMTLYGGLSGLDCALFALLAADLLWERREQRGTTGWWLGAALTGVLAGKIGFEAATGATLFVANLGSGVEAVPVAHAVGAGIGVLCATIGRGWQIGPRLVAPQVGGAWS